MSPAKSVVAALAAAMLTTTGLAGTAVPASSTEVRAFTATTADETQAARAVRQRGKLLMYPQLAHPGAKPMSPSRAKSSMAAKFKPAKRGRTVVLQQKRGKRWVNVAKARQSGRGIAEFNAPYARRGKVQTYRAYTVRYKGLPKTTTRAVSAAKWGNADLSDTFDGSALPANWAHRPTTPPYQGKRKCAVSRDHPDNILVSGGALRLSVTRNARGRLRIDPVTGLPFYDPTCQTDYGTYDYRYTGHVSTQDTKAFKYGFAAARLKFHREAGQHGGLWLMPATSTVDNPGTEIDVIEFFGDRANSNTELSSFVQRVWTGDKDNTCGLISNTRRYGSDWWTKYHVFSVEWTRKGYTFRIDGKKTCRTSRLVSHTAEYLILSIQANDYELKYSKNLPQHMYVDWVRFWQL